MCDRLESCGGQRASGGHSSWLHIHPNAENVAVESLFVFIPSYDLVSYVFFIVWLQKLRKSARTSINFSMPFKIDFLWDAGRFGGAK